MSPNASPFSTATLKRLPRNAYAYRKNEQAWYIRQDEQGVNTTIANGNSETLTASDYYAMPVDAVIVAEIVSRSFTVAQHIDKAYNG
jgi:hypothetical protein